MSALWAMHWLIASSPSKDNRFRVESVLSEKAFLDSRLLRFSAAIEKGEPNHVL